jgi:hypothetical protein
MRLFLDETQIKSTRIWRASFVMTFFESHRVFWNVERLTMHAYWIWRIMISKCWTICSYFHFMSRKVMIWMRWSRVNSNCFLKVTDVFIMMRRMLNENFDEDNYIWLTSHISARITLTIILSTYQVSNDDSHWSSLTRLDLVSKASWVFSLRG